MKTKTRQIWRCPKCGNRYESPAIVERAYCDKHPNGAPAMKLEGERAQ